MTSTTFANVRQLEVVNNQLYASSDAGTNSFKGLETVGTGLPTSGSQAVTRLPGLSDATNPSSYSYFFADLSASVPGPDTLYVADESGGAGGGVTKFSLVNNSWVSNGTVGLAADAYRGLTGAVSGTTVTLFATRNGGSGATGGGQVVRIVDSSGYNGALAGTPTLLATAAANTAFRGVALAPLGTSINDAPTIDAIPDPTAILQDTGQQTINLTGIAAGNGDNQTLTVTAVSSDTTLIPNPTVTYTSPNATGTLTYTPVAGASGNATITVTVKDNGGTANGGVDTTVRTFTVAVTAVNHAPTLGAIGPVAILQNSGTQFVPLAGIGDGDKNTQTLTVTAVSSNTALIPTPSVSYSSPSQAGTLSFAPATNQTGTATITVTVMDSGGTANGGVDTFFQTFRVSVGAINHAPTLAALPDVSGILENSGPRRVSLGGIGDGDGGTQTLSVTAVSSNPALISNPAVTYSSGDSTGSLVFNPVANASGSAVITVTVKDNGGTAGGGVDTVTQSFVVNITPVNQAPTLNPIANPAAILENTTTPQTVILTGITAGSGESQNLTVTAVSSNPALIPNPGVIYTSPNTLGTLTYTPVPYASGTATITVTVMDDGDTSNGGVNTFTRSFTVAVTPVNQPPTLDPIANPAPVFENSGPQVVNLTGITAGTGESQQTLTVTAVSSNPAIVPNPTVSYASPNTTGFLTYTPTANANGTAIITVTVNDSGTTANGGVNTFSRTFAVTVTPVNQAPTLNTIPNATILANAGTQTINLSGITAGGSESQDLTVTAVSSNQAPIFNPTITYTSPGNTGQLTYRPAPGASGTATISVIVQDSGGTANGGVDTTVHTFTVTVTPVNRAPDLAAIAPITILENSGTQTVPLTGIGDGDGDTQNLNVFAVTTSNPTLIPNPIVTYTTPGATGSLKFTPAVNGSGTATITVTVKDSGGTVNGGVDTTTQSFVVNVTEVNQARVRAP